MGRIPQAVVNIKHTQECPARTSTYYACKCAGQDAEIDRIEHVYKLAGGTLPGAPMQHGPAMCFHGYYPAGCPWCNDHTKSDLYVPAVSEAEKDRRLKAFMPLLHAIVKYVDTADQRASATEQIERILEVVENPRRKVAEDGE